jgi:hypothetical protein
MSAMVGSGVPSFKLLSVSNNYYYMIKNSHDLPITQGIVATIAVFHLLKI